MIRVWYAYLALVTIARTRCLVVLVMIVGVLKRAAPRG